MKIKHLFGLAVLAAMTASCSSNDELVSGGTTGASEAGTGYATFTINLPTSNGGTRAADNPTFDKGDAKEYDVNNATLVIFEKPENATSEQDYKFVESVELGNMAPWVKVDANGITTEARITTKLSQTNLTGDYYALVLLNNKDKNDAPKVTLPETNDTYGSWNVDSKATAEKFADNTKGYYMANAPEFTTSGTEPTTLVKINKIYSNKQDAENNTGTTVHVERGLAKVTVEAFPNDLSATGTKYSNDKVDITGWKLDVTNTKTFPVHKFVGLTTNFDNIWKNESGSAPVTARFVDGGNNAFKRIYWGIDPNYDKDYATVDACGQEFTLLASNAVIDGTATEPQYCLENTFDIKHMLQGQTTRVVFKADYTPNGFNKGDNFYKIGNSTDLWSENTLTAQIKAKAAEVLNVEESKIDVDLEATNNNIKSEAGTRLLTTDNVKNDNVNVSEENIASINEKLGLKAKTETDPIVGIATYKAGVSYYIARVKHFGNDLTPWSEGDDTYGDNNATQNNKYLGRYGVLRNNWYELTVNSVSGPGYPDVPTINPTTPDDENFKYINVSVKILDWAKRSQSVDL